MKTKSHNQKIIFVFIFTVLIFPIIVSCASNDQTVLMQQDIARLDTEIGQLKAELKRSSETKEEKYVDLQNQLDTITNDLKALSAKSDDLLQRMDENDRAINRLKKRLEAQEMRLAELEKKISKEEEKPRKRMTVPIASDITGTPSPIETMYDDAYLSFTRGNFPEARKKFRAFLKKYPKTAYSDNARFWIGETYYSEGDFESAILEYEKVIRSYPRGDKVPSALLKEGLAFIKLGDKTDGTLVLKKLIKRFPRTDQAKIATRILRNLR